MSSVITVRIVLVQVSFFVVYVSVGFVTLRMFDRVHTYFCICRIPVIIRLCPIRKVR